MHVLLNLFCPYPGRPYPGQFGFPLYLPNMHFCEIPLPLSRAPLSRAFWVSPVFTKHAFFVKFICPYPGRPYPVHFGFLCPYPGHALHKFICPPPLYVWFSALIQGMFLLSSFNLIHFIFAFLSSLSNACFAWFLCSYQLHFQFLCFVQSKFTTSLCPYPEHVFESVDSQEYWKSRSEQFVYLAHLAKCTPPPLSLSHKKPYSNRHCKQQMCTSMWDKQIYASCRSTKIDIFLIEKSIFFHQKAKSKSQIFASFYDPENLRFCSPKKISDMIKKISDIDFFFENLRYRFSKGSGPQGRGWVRSLRQQPRNDDPT